MHWVQTLLDSVLRKIMLGSYHHIHDSTIRRHGFIHFDDDRLVILAGVVFDKY